MSRVGRVISKLGIAQLALRLGEALPGGVHVAGDKVEIVADGASAPLQVPNVHRIERLAGAVDVALQSGDVIAHITEGIVCAGGVGCEARDIFAGAAEVAIMLQIALDACPGRIQAPLGIAQARLGGANRRLARKRVTGYGFETLLCLGEIATEAIELVSGHPVAFCVGQPAGEVVAPRHSALPHEGGIKLLLQHPLAGAIQCLLGGVDAPAGLEDQAAAFRPTEVRLAGGIR